MEGSEESALSLKYVSLPNTFQGNACSLGTHSLGKELMSQCHWHVEILDSFKVESTSGSSSVKKEYRGWSFAGDQVILCVGGEFPR